MTNFSNFAQTCMVSGKILHLPYKVYGKGPNFKKNQPSIIRLLKLRFEFFGLLPTAKINDDNLETQLTNVNRYDDIRILSIYVCRFFFRQNKFLDICLSFTKDTAEMKSFSNSMRNQRKYHAGLWVPKGLIN